MKSQAATDYIILAGVIITIIVPLLYYSTGQVDTVRMHQASDAVKTVESTAVKLTGLGYGSCDRAIVQIPHGITNATINGTTIHLEIAGQDVFVDTEVPLTGLFPTTPGRHFLSMCNNGTHLLFYECGNGQREAFEQCDDPDISWCASGQTCGAQGTEFECACHCIANEDCPAGTVCENDYCVPGGYCGNGILNTGEQCDDGCNQGIPGVCEPVIDDEDGCSSSCMLEYCGDGIIQTGLGEQCDLDSSSCAPGESCVQPGHPDQCTCQSTSGLCGDGTIDQNEYCDDGNLDSKTCFTLLSDYTQSPPDAGILGCYAPGSMWPDNPYTPQDEGSNPSECFFDISQCELCGNGIVNHLEDCEVPSTTILPPPFPTYGPGYDANCSGKCGPSAFYLPPGSPLRPYQCKCLCADQDGDGHFVQVDPSLGIPCPPADCDDTNPSINPSAAEICTGNIDEDCDRLVDCDDPDCSSKWECIPGCSSLISYWNLSDGSGLIANDFVDNNDGTLTNGPTWTTDAMDTYAIKFDGTDDYVEVGNKANLSFTTQEFTIEGWIKPDIQTVATTTSILGKIKPTIFASDNGYRIEYNSQFVFFTLEGGFGAYAIVGAFLAADTTPASNFHHFAAVKTSTSIYLYVDGVKSDPWDLGFDATVISNPNPFRIGNTPVLAGEDPRFFKGIIDEVSVYNTALSEAIILSHYNQGSNGCNPPDTVCGDGIQDGQEECDLGAANSDTGQCNTNCRFTKCTDNIVQKPDGRHFWPNYNLCELCDDSTSNCKRNSCIPEYNCPSEIIAYWKFDEGCGSVLSDFASGDLPSNYPGKAINNPTFIFPGLLEYGLSFAPTKYIEVDHNPALTFSWDQPFSIEAWIKKDPSTGREATILWKGPLALGSNNRYSLSLTSEGKPRFTVAGSSSLSEITGTIDLVDNTWRHIVAVRSQSSYLALFIDGQLDAAVSDGIVMGDTNIGGTDKLYINNGPSGSSTISIDEVAIYNEPLDICTIRFHYNNGAGNNYCPAPPGCSGGGCGCGDGILQQGEECGDTGITCLSGKVCGTNCKWRCVPLGTSCGTCGNGVCEFKDGPLCSDCGSGQSTCGNGRIDRGEQCETCAAGSCPAGQSCVGCKCGFSPNSCGDGYCEGDESCDTCPDDCGGGTCATLYWWTCALQTCGGGQQCIWSASSYECVCL